MAGMTKRASVPLLAAAPPPHHCWYPQLRSDVLRRRHCA